MEHATSVASAVTIYILITDFGLRTRKSIYCIYSPLGLSRFENSVLCFWPFTLLERGLHSKQPFQILLLQDSEEHCIYIELMGSHVLRTKNIHCALRIGAFPFSERIRRARIVLRVFLSRFTIRMRRVYRALYGSHALRTKNIHCVLCFGAFTILERETYISSAFSLSCFGTPKSTVYLFRRYRALTL